MSPRLAVVVVIFLAVPSSAFQLRKDSQGDVVRWPGKVEFVIDARLAHDLGEANAEAAVRAAIAALAEATPSCEVKVRVGTVTGLGYQVGASDNQNDIMALEDWPYDGNALAATVVTLNASTNEIIDADIVFNAENHHFRVVDELGPNEKTLVKSERLDDVQNTVTHELGHALGLLHNETDSTVVMYPSAGPLEVSKRVLAADDKAGLLELYATPFENDGVGCSSTAGFATPLAIVALLGIFLRRARARAAVLLVAAPLWAFASEPVDRVASDLESADEVSVARVKAKSSIRLPGNPRLIFTDVELEVGECVKGSCPARRVVRVPGGRLGDIEQVVAHQPVPALDEQILFIKTSRSPRVVRVSDATDQTLIRGAFERARLSLPVSLVPQTSAQPRAGGAQAPGFAR